MIGLLIFLLAYSAVGLGTAYVCTRYDLADDEGKFFSSIFWPAGIPIIGLIAAYNYIVEQAEDARHEAYMAKKKKDV